MYSSQCAYVSSLDYVRNFDKISVEFETISDFSSITLYTYTLCPSLTHKYQINVAIESIEYKITLGFAFIILLYYLLLNEYNY